MSPDEWPERVSIMIEDIDRVLSFIDGRTRDEFKADEESVFAVSYAFVRLGEAVVHVPVALRESHPEIEWGDIRQFRNFVTHVYVAVDAGRLHDTAVQFLPDLRAKLARVLSSNG